MSDASTLIERGAEERLFVFDRRIGKQSHELIINFNDIKSFDDFHSKIKDVICYIKFVFSPTHKLCL